MIIRDATPEDAPAVAGLWEEFIGLHESIDSHYARAEDGTRTFQAWVKQCVNSADALVLVAEMNGAVVGYALATIEAYAPIFKRDRYGLLSDLAVTKAYRRKGIGERLARKVLSWFQRNNVREVHLFVLRGNEGARRFWERLGWRGFVEQMVLDLE